MTAREKAITLETQLDVAHDHIADLEHLNQQALSQVDHCQAEADKALELLKNRTERFAESRDRIEAEKRRIRAMAIRRIESLERQHHLELSRSEAKVYRLHRSHLKDIARLDTHINNLTKSHLLEVSKLQDQVDSSAMELAQCKASKEYDLKVAEKNARVEERQHYSKLVDAQKCKNDKLSSKVVDLQQTTEEEHQASLGKNATNDPAESPFAQLTHQLQVFGRVLGIHASAIGQAKINGDFKRAVDGKLSDGAYFRLPPEMQQSLMAYALLSAPAVRKEEKVQLNVQREAKLEKQ